jgi:hypothetical protein
VSAALIDITFISTLDDACIQVQNAMDEDRAVHEIHVSPQFYDAMVSAKRAQHLDRGNPLLLLALDLVRDENIPPGTALVC